MDQQLKNSLKAAELEFKKEPMDSYYNNFLAGYPSRLRVKKILKELGSINNKKVLDIGCEAGYVSLKILEKKPSAIYAIDICEEALEEFKKKLKNKRFDTEIIIKKAFMQNLPFKDNFFDAVVCTEVIEHAPQLEKSLEEVKRVLKKGGKFIVTFPNEKLRKKVYFIVKLMGINTDVEKDVTLFEYSLKEIVNKLGKHFAVKKVYTIPKFFPLTHFIICNKP